MSDVSVDDVKKLALLAAIQVTDEEAAALTTELDAILGYVKQLDAVDTSGLEPTYQVNGLKNITRPDKIIEYGVNQQTLLKNAPRQNNGSIEVPKVL